MRRSFAVCFLLLWVAVAGAQNWPSFRGPAASGVAQNAQPPVSWDAPRSVNVAWKTPIPGLSHSSPIVWGDRVFITTAISSDPNSEFRHGLYGDVTPAKDLSKHTWKVYALEKQTGKIIWERTAHEGLPKTKRHPKSTQATPTPVTDGKHLVVFFGSEGLYCYDLGGKLLWKQDLGLLNPGWFYDPDYEWGVASSPIIYRDTVIVQCDIQQNSFVAAYSLRDGKRVWMTPRDEIPSFATPTVYEGKARAELITHATKYIRGYDPASGKELWRLGPNSEIATPTPFAAHDLIFVTNGYRGIQPIYAVRPGSTGDISLKDNEESNQYIAWSKKRGGPYTPTPVVYGDHFYTVSNNGVLTVYNAKTGERIYQQRIGDKGGAYSASPVAAGGKVYFTSEDGEIYVVQAGPKYELLATNTMGEVCMATPAISGDMLIVRTERHLYGIRRKKP